MLPGMKWSVLALAIVVTATACDATAATEAAPTGSPDPSWVTDFLGPITDEQAVRDLFEVEAENPEFWRVLALDRYDGDMWTSTNPGGSRRGVRLSAPAILPRPAGGASAEGETLSQTFRVLGEILPAHALPMAQTAESIAGPIGGITWDPATGAAFIDGDLDPGMEYTVRSRIVVPTPEELDRIVHRARGIDGPWTGLPADLDPQIGRIAERWAAGATSDYRKVLAIQQRFQDGSFNYDANVATSVDDESLVEFLTRTKVGFCQHYSSAMAVMVRTLGIPARIGVGYRSGTRQADGSYLVQTDDIHVWVEVLFPGYGWLQFEPEAGSEHPNAQIGTYLNPGPTHG
jgi:transglutaminase-like putative cysteine protease